MTDKSTQPQATAHLALAADDRFPGGLADAVACVNELEELAEALHQKVFGHESDGESGASTVLQMTLRQLNEKHEQAGEVQGDAHVLVLREMRARLTDAGSPARTSALDAAIAALAARQPVGEEPVDEIFAAFRADGSLAGTAFSAEAAGYWSGCKVVRYAAPTAQAVALGQFREAVVYQRDAFKHYAPYTNNPEYSRIINKCDRLLALIDQRDAAPGVQS